MSTETPKTWDPLRWPTAQEWRDWFISMPIDEQLERAEKVVLSAVAAHECLVQGHDNTLERLELVPRRLLQARHDAWAEGHTADPDAVNPHTPAPVAPPLAPGTQMPVLDARGDHVGVATVGDEGAVLIDRGARS